jgi:hypothetical protein
MAGRMTLPRMLVLLAVGIAFADYRYGNGRLIDKASDQTTQLGSWLKDEFWQVQHKIAPFH